MVNNGDDTFTIEPARASDEVLHNVPQEWWQHIGNHLVDLDNDGDLELVLGSLSPITSSLLPGRNGMGSPSMVLVNDGCASSSITWPPSRISTATAGTMSSRLSTWNTTSRERTD